MAQDKKSFLFYVNWIEIFEPLPNEIRGELIMHILRYVNDENPTTDNFIVKSLFAVIQDTLKRDLKKWDSQREQRAEASKKGVEARRLKAEQRRLLREQGEQPIETKNQSNVNRIDFQSFINDDQTFIENNRAVNRAVTNGQPNVNRNQPVNSKLLIVSTDVDDNAHEAHVDDKLSFEEIQRRKTGDYFESEQYREAVSVAFAKLKSYAGWKTDIAKSLELVNLAEVDVWLDKYQARVLEITKDVSNELELKRHFINYVRKCKSTGAVVVQRPMTAKEKQEARNKRFITT